jgi:hypothetical protein
MTKASIEELVALAKAAAASAADNQERFAATDIEARKIVDIMENFLRIKGRVVYGGAAINAHLPPATKFYDPNLYLPDYDFMTPDPLQDCADLITTFQADGFDDVEAKFGIHEGTYKIFVNYRAAADITFMPPEVYRRIISDAAMIDGIRYASVNFLRMNMYLELSRPAGDVSRWEKVYKRLILLNDVKPLRAGHCVTNPLERLGAEDTDTDNSSEHDELFWRITEAGIAANAIFLSGLSLLRDIEPNQDDPILLLTDKPTALIDTFVGMDIKPQYFPAIGELLPARTEFYRKRAKGTKDAKDAKPVAVVFETVACHAYTTLKEPAGYRLGSLDLLIQMYYAMYFAELQSYVSVRLLCLIQELIELDAERRASAATKSSYDGPDVFPLDCIGHQPSLPELKKAHRERVRAKRNELIKALRLQTDFVARPTRKPKRKQSLA